MSTALVSAQASPALAVHESIKAPAMAFRVHLGGATPPAKVISTLHEACASLAITERYTGKLRLLVGRLVLIAAERKLYKPDFPTLKDFLADLTSKYGVAVSTLFESYRIAKKLPFLTPEKYEALGPAALLGATRMIDDHGPKVRKAIEAAESPMALQEALGRLSSTRGTGTIGIGLKVSPETEREWQQVQKLYAEEAGSESPSEIFAWLVHSIIVGQKVKGPQSTPGLRRRTKTA